MNFITMKPGKRVDSLVAKRVMEWERIPPYGRYRTKDGEPTGYNPDSKYNLLWQPTSNLLHAWEVLEKLVADGWEVTLCSAPNGEGWNCKAERRPNRYWNLQHETAPFAICLTALATTMKERE